MVDVLHINDNNLRLVRGGEQFTSQGYAWLAGEQVHFDLGSSTELSAVKRCRLTPQEINNRYWMQCDQSAIAPNTAGMRHAADLIWQHLSQLKSQFRLSEVTLVVPSHYRSENLQLLLGVAKACDLKISALLNKATLALASRGASNGDYVHLDVQLHQTVSARLSVNNGLVTLGNVETLQDVGIHLMQEALLKGLQNSFIQNDRFDPLHEASTEQQLFDQLPHIAEQIAANGKADIGVEHQGKLHRTALDAKEWQSLLSSFAARLTQVSVGETVFDLNSAFGTASLAGLEGGDLHMIDGVPKMPLDPLIVTSTENNSAVVYQTDIAVRTTDRSAKASEQIDSPPPLSKDRATHLLSAGKAIPIAQAEVLLHDNTLSVTVGSANVASLLSSGRLFVMNDEGRTQLQPNDRLGSHMADGVMTVIQVV